MMAEGAGAHAKEALNSECSSNIWPVGVVAMPESHPGHEFLQTPWPDYSSCCSPKQGAARLFFFDVLRELRLFASIFRVQRCGDFDGAGSPKKQLKIAYHTADYALVTTSKNPKYADITRSTVCS